TASPMNPTSATVARYPESTGHDLNSPRKQASCLASAAAPVGAEKLYAARSAAVPTAPTPRPKSHARGSPPSAAFHAEARPFNAPLLDRRVWVCVVVTWRLKVCVPPAPPRASVEITATPRSAVAPIATVRP